MRGAVLDTCVLLPATLCDLLLRLSEMGLYDVKWSPEILDELQRNLIIHGLLPVKASRRIDMMTRAFPHAAIENFERMIPRVTNDPKDRHVLAAAIAGEANTIVTFNVRDFPPHSVQPWSVKVVHPDTFLTQLLSDSKRAVADALTNQSAHYSRPPVTIEQILARLSRTGVPLFAAQCLSELEPTPPTK